MGKASRDKGKRGELEAAHLLEDVWGVRAKRGQQHQGGDDSPDVRTAMDGVTFEVKRRERISVYDALDQAYGDCGDGQIPALLYRRNRSDWLLVMKADDLPQFVAQYLKAVGIEVPGFDGKLF